MSSMEYAFQLFNNNELGIGDVIFLFQLLKNTNISVQVLVFLISTPWPYKKMDREINSED